jgi:hypothetical protein
MSMFAERFYLPEQILASAKDMAARRNGVASLRKPMAALEREQMLRNGRAISP